MSCWWIIRLNISEFHYYDITILCSPTVHDSMKYSWTVFSLVESERQTSNSEGCLFFILIQTSSGNLLLGHLKAGFPFSHNCHIFFDCFYLSTQVTIIDHFIIKAYNYQILWKPLETRGKLQKKTKITGFFRSKSAILQVINILIFQYYSEKELLLFDVEMATWNCAWYWMGDKIKGFQFRFCRFKIDFYCH